LVSTDKCYANREWEHGYRETDALGGHDPYSASKAAMEIAVAAYRDSFFSPACDGDHGVRVASVRAGNVIGGGDWAKDRIVPDAIRALCANQPIAVRNPDSVRPWQHVLEPLSGYLWLGARLADADGARLGAAWNFGPAEGEDHSVARLVEMIVAAWGGGSWRSVHRDDAPRESRMLRLSIDKARHHLAWHPVWDLATAVRRSVDWYKRVLDDPSRAAVARRACTVDIEAYETAAIEQGLAWTI
jgi:CDP-glucose 4,6-dehydratase